MSSQPKPPTREEQAGQRYYPTVVSLLGHDYAHGDPDQLRALTIDHVRRRLRLASWQTLTLALRLVEGEPVEVDAPATPAKPSKRKHPTVTDFVAHKRRVAGAARVALRSLAVRIGLPAIAAMICALYLVQFVLAAFRRVTAGVVFIPVIVLTGGGREKRSCPRFVRLLRESGSSPKVRVLIARWPCRVAANRRCPPHGHQPVGLVVNPGKDPVR